MGPKLKSILLIAIATIAISLSPFALLQAQPSPMFQVIHLPRKAAYSKDKLNTELAQLKDKDAVKKLLRSKNFPQQTAIVIYINRANNLSAYWTINTSSPSDKEENRIILQSRDNVNTKFHKLSEFKNLFKDTLAVIDTLSVELLIKDDDYPDDQYKLASLCAKTKTETNIPFQNGKLLFTKELLGKCQEPASQITIYNSNNEDRILANCRLCFLTSDQQDMLLSMADFIRTSEPDKTTKDIAFLVNGYATAHFGGLYFPQLLNWLEKNFAAISHGDHR